MSSSSSKPQSKSFKQIYDSLPPDAQRALLEKHLVPLLDHLPDTTTGKVVNAAKDMQKRYAGMPILNLKAKQAELDGLLLDLDRDAKRSFVRERSVRDELLEEIIDTLSKWMNDIWSVVYEYQTNFALAHQCLLVAADIIGNMSMPTGGCKCSTMNLYISTLIRRRKTRKVVKSFQLTGVPSFERIILWIWRDLFVSLLASSPDKAAAVPDMLQDIQNTMGWMALERMLVGGKMKNADDDEDEDAPADDLEDDFGDETDDEDEASDEDAWCDETLEDVEWHGHILTCPFHAEHWTRFVDDKHMELRRIVQRHLVSYFDIAPSLALHSGIQAISPYPEDIGKTLLKLMQENALSTSDCFVAALDIFAHEEKPDIISSLLQRGSHLLRPRDASVYQNAVLALSRNRTMKPFAMSIVEKELLDTARSLRAALHTSFSRLGSTSTSAELDKILKLSSSSLTRQNRIETWVDSVITPGTHPTHPMAFAAMMMGLPIPGADDMNDADPIGYLELDKNDPDLDDLRDELKPGLKDRFEGWVACAAEIHGASILVKVLREVTVMMPFLRAGDIVDEMLNRLSDKPSKHHVCDGLEALHAFVKAQKRKVVAAQEKQKRKDAAKTAKAASTSGPSGSAASTSSSRPGIFSVPLFNSGMPSTFGGIEDVD